MIVNEKLTKWLLCIQQSAPKSDTCHVDDDGVLYSAYNASLKKATGDGDRDCK